MISGREIEKEIEFGIHKKSNRNHPFTIEIIYHIDKNRNIDIIFENSKNTMISGYLLLSIGISFLFYTAFRYDGQITIILDFINNLIK